MSSADFVSIQQISHKWRADKEVMFAAVKRLPADKEVVLAAVNTDGAALTFASASVQHDREVVLAAVEQCFFFSDLLAEDGILGIAFRSTGTYWESAKSGGFGKPVNIMRSGYHTNARTVIIRMREICAALEFPGCAKSAPWLSTGVHLSTIFPFVWLKWKDPLFQWKGISCMRTICISLDVDEGIVLQKWGAYHRLPKWWGDYASEYI